MLSVNHAHIFVTISHHLCCQILNGYSPNAITCVNLSLN
jgi:hypothetical protein